MGIQLSTEGISQFAITSCDVSNTEYLTLSPLSGEPENKAITKDGWLHFPFNILTLFDVLKGNCVSPSLCAEHGRLTPGLVSTLFFVLVILFKELENHVFY